MKPLLAMSNLYIYKYQILFIEHLKLDFNLINRYTQSYSGFICSWFERTEPLIDSLAISLLSLSSISQSKSIQSYRHLSIKNFTF